ncbi:MAG: phosphotransacetylase family protein [Dehalococcoidia bacterium]|nr:phosphotransacetylase family protein [Dehalococcoidia bacterium]
MAVLLVLGTERGAGKTALATALAYQLVQHGQRVRLAKPVTAKPGTDADVPFYRRIVADNAHSRGLPLALKPNPSPVGTAGSWRQQLAATLDAEVSILDEPDLAETPDTATQLAQELDAQASVIARHRPDLDAARLVAALGGLRKRVVGVLINQVPEYRSLHATESLARSLQAAGIACLGVLPEDRRMLAPTLRQVAEVLDGRFLLFEDKGDELVEHIMVGGWFLEEGRYVFSRRERKAVLVRGDRPDLQMAALEADTVGLVLTGGKPPVQYAVYEAETRGVPIVATQLGTVEAMERLQGLNTRPQVHHPEKVKRFLELLATTSVLDQVAKVLSLPDLAPGAQRAQPSA